MTGDYKTVRAAAQAKANELGFDYGVEKTPFGFRYFMLPAMPNRCGHELQCEVVMCENLEHCKHGHGPQ